jgi:uncharacterized SAM-dependent methyltransferase
MNAAFIRSRITAIEAQIVAYEAAALALATGGVQSYTLDTGQSKKTVTKLDLVNLQATINGLMNQLVVYEARLTGNGVLIARPGF